MIRSYNLQRNGYSFLFMLLVLCVGLLVYKDYGICWDEVFQYNDNGRVVYDFVVNAQPDGYLNSSEKYHGSIFELGLYSISEGFNLGTDREIYLMRHLFSFLFYWCSGFFMIGILNRLFKNRWITLIGLAMYFIAPRIFPDAFYNSKDIPFLAILTASVFTYLKFMDRPTIASALFHACACGLLIGIRITGLIVPVLTTGFYFLSILMQDNKIERVKYLFVFIFFSVGFTILFWPILWFDPLHHFMMAWEEMRRFGWDSTVVFKGKIIWANTIPWYYIPFWIYVTTPPLYIILFLISLVLLVYNFIKVKTANRDMLHWMFILALFFIPLISVIWFKSILYDGWRHMYFLYVPFILIGTYCLQFIFSENQWYKVAMRAAVFIILLSNAVTMIRLHPYEHVYFNHLYYDGLKGARFNMEMDYWGLTYQEGLRYILDHDNSPKIKVRVDNAGGMFNLKLLKDYQLERLDVSMDKEREYKYLIGNYRWMQSEYYEEKEVYAIMRDSARICTVILMEK